MLRFDWLSHLKTRRLKRRRKTGRKAIRNSAELLQIRTMLSGDPIASMAMGDGHGDIDHGGHDHSNQNGDHTQHAHPAAMVLISTDQATNTVVATGDWSDPAVWENGTLPADGARIIIPQGMTLTVDSVIPQEFKTIGIHGTLSFATDVDTELRVDTIISAPHGRFEMGTETNPIAASVTARVVFVDDGVIDTNWDPEQLSRGAVLQGPTEIHGAEATHQVSLAAHPAAGATTLQLSSVPVGWNAGDEIIITGTQGSTSDEVRTIAAIDGTSVTLNQALELDHIAPRTDLNVYVANTTRNVELTSENAATAHRGHVMFMHTNNVSVRNAAFTDLGRTDKKIPLDDYDFEFPEDAVGNRTSAGVVFTATPGARTNVRGRYPVHFHRGGTDPSSTRGVVDGSVVIGSPGYGLVNHSSNVDLTNNVSYDIHGSAFYTEAGDEIGSIANNIAIRTVNPDFRLEDNGEISVDLRADQQDFGVDGDAFWLSGHLVSMTGNIASGASGHGIIIWSDGLVEVDRSRTTVKTSDIENGHLITGRDTIPTWWAPLAEIANNESSNATIGFRTRYIHSSIYLGDVGSPFHEPPDQAYIDTLSPTIDGLTVWGSRDGALLNYSERLSLRNADIIGIGAEYVRQDGTTDLGVGIDMYNESSRGPGVVENVSVEGFNMGILAPRHGEWQMSNVHLRNTTDLHIEQATIEARTLDMTNVTFGDLAGTAVADNESLRRNVVIKGDGTGNQPFWFLLTDTVSLNGQGLYFNQQAAGHVPLTTELLEDSPVPAEFVGLTNQELQDTYGTSFAGEITPTEAHAVSWLTGGVVGRLAEPGQADPPLYEMRDADTFDVVSLGTLSNFDPTELPTETPEDHEGEDIDPDGDDEGPSNLMQLIGELRELSEADLQTRVEAFEPNDEGAVDLLEELSKIRELDDEELAEELGQLEEEEREELTKILQGLGLGNGPADDDGDDSDEEDGDEPDEDGDEEEEPGGEGESGDEDGGSDEEDTDEDDADEEGGEEEEPDGEGSDDDGETDDEDSDSDDTELGQLIADLRALSESDLQSRVEAFEVDAQGAADLLEELRMIRDLDDEQLETELAELEPIERAELAEVLRGLGLGDSGDEEDGEDDDTDEEDHGDEETDGDGGSDDHDHEGDQDHDGDSGDTGGDHGHGDHDDTSCGAHVDNPVLAGEHCAAMALATPEAASHTLIASGDWSDTSVWQNGVALTDNADVYIPAGMTLTVDGVITETIHTIRIDGTLRFATDVNTELKVDTIVGARGSVLEIGTEAKPIVDDVTARIIFADGGEIDRTWDPSQISRGAILHGQTVMFGAEKTAFTTLAQPARAGDSTLTLSEVPIGWRVGDELVIAGTDPADVASDETVTIVSIDGTSVTLNQALARDHAAPASDLSVHVANNSRNIQLSSENPELSRRGHVMFMHTLNVDVNYAGFYQLGRTDKSRPVDDYSFNDLDAAQITYGPGTNVRGRYSVHFHRGGTDPTQTSARVRGAVVAGNPGWGYVNHSANVDFISNVAYDVTGAAFNNEAGDELGSYVGNIALRVVNPNDPLNSDEEFDADAREAAQDFGFQGDGFWLQGAGTRLENNVVAGNSGTAFFYWPEGLLEPGLGMMQVNAAHLPNGELLAGRKDQTINTWWNPVAGFQNNTAYNVGVGLEVIYLHTTYLNGDDDMLQEYVDQLHSTFDGLTVWHSRGGGLKVGYTERVTFSNIRLHGVGEEDSVGVAANQYQNQKTLNFVNMTVDGFGIGMETPPQGNITISGDFSNLIDFYIENPQRTARTMEFSDITFSDPTVFEEISERRNFELQANFEVNDDKHSAFFLLPDRINLNFGDFSGQALYFNEQHPDFVPMPSQPEDSESVVIAPEFLGKTSQQLFDEFGLSFGGALLPGDATTDSELILANAEIGTVAEPPTTFPPGGFPEDEEDEDFPDDEDPEDGDPEDENPGDEHEEGDEEGSSDEDSDDDGESDDEDSDSGDAGEGPSGFYEFEDIPIHDPSSVVRDGNMLIVYGSGVDGAGLVSFIYDLESGEIRKGDGVFNSPDDKPGWIGDIQQWNPTGEFDAPAAPDANTLYYTVFDESDVGIQDAIGLATREDDGTWTDQGIVVRSVGEGDHPRAMDPGILRDEDGRSWMIFGSHAGGIYSVELDPITGKLKDDPENVLIDPEAPENMARFTLLASRGQGAEENTVEAAYITRRDDEYFLFVNFDACCNGVDSTYNIRVGRSNSPTGPFTDRDGVNLTEGGGSLVLDSQGEVLGNPDYIGPGHAGIFTLDDKDYFTFHFYHGSQDGEARFAARQLDWDEDGWPVIGDEGPGGEDDKPREDGDETPDDLTFALPAGDSDVTIEEGVLVVAQGGEAVSETSLNGVSTLTLTGTSDAEAIILDLRNGTDLNLESISVLAGDGDDTVTFLGAGSAEVMIAGEGGNDLLIGSSGDEQIAGGDGNDTMIGGAGRDDLSGGAGNDVLIGNGGHDTLDGGEGDDFARGDSGNDDITAGSGADVLLGRAGNDTLRFSRGIDSADGGAGNNVMVEDSTSSDAAPEIGGTNVEIAISDAGDPVSLILQNGSLVVSEDRTVQRRITLDATETLTITGSTGDDEININFSRPGAVQLTSLTIDGQAGNDVISIDGLAATLADSILASGGLGNDVITLNRDIRQAVTADGGAGHDSITTARGRDIIRGGDGNDFIDGGAQRDFIKGDRGHDRIFGRGGSDRIYGGSGFDTINGNGGNDLILGNSGDDFLKGASGNDRILGHGGNDVLRGDAGDDILQAGDGQDVLLGNAGNDGLSAGAGNDLVFGHTGNDSLVGGDGDDTCSGHSGDDIVMGQSGDDLITGHGGNDILTGGDGTDEVTGSESEIDEDFTFLADWIDSV